MIDLDSFFGGFLFGVAFAGVLFVIVITPPQAEEG